MSLFSVILQSLYFFLPAYCANMAPVLFRWIPWGAKPVSEKYFGNHKTWRGLATGTLVGVVVFILQKYVLAIPYWSLIDYADFSLWLGFLMGAGAMLGDLVKSYYKRKANIPPGESWMPADQLDFVFGALIAGFFVFVPPAEVAAVLVVLSPVLHLGVNYLGYLLKINHQKW